MALSRGYNYTLFQNNLKQIPYTGHHNPLLIRNRSWKLTIHKPRLFWKKLPWKQRNGVQKWGKNKYEDRNWVSGRLLAIARVWWSMGIVKKERTNSNSTVCWEQIILQLLFNPTKRTPLEIYYQNYLLNIEIFWLTWVLENRFL